jgi:hypothetical protein
MTTSRRNFLLPGMVIATGVAMLLLALDVPHENLADLIRRSWPVLLMIGGLNMLLIDRVRFGNWLALALSLVGLAAVVYFAYDTRTNLERTDYIETVQPVPLGDNINTVNVTVSVKNARVTFRATDNADRAIGATFIGSTESEVRIAILEDEGGVVNLSVVEHRPNSIPNLERTGRGDLQVLLPVGVSISGLTFVSESGGTLLDFRILDVTRFDVTLGTGNMDLFLPLRGVAIGDVNISDGDLNIVNEADASLRLTGAPEPEEDNNVNGNTYLILAGNIIESRGGLSNFQYNLGIDIGGILTIETSEERAAREAAEAEQAN